MRRSPRTARTARTAAAVAAVLAAGAFSAAPAAAEEAYVEKFEAHHSLGCEYGYTEGELNWAPLQVPEDPPAVRVDGVLGEKDEADCETSRQTFAQFVAYTGMGREQVDLEVVYFDGLTDANGVRPFTFNLTNETGSSDARIDLIAIRVCDEAGPMLPAFTCGEPTYYTTEMLTPSAPAE